MTMTNLGWMLKNIRIFNHLTQLELSDKIKLSRSYLSEIESGKKTPTIEILKKYSNYFDIPLSAILLFAENYDNKKDLKNKAKKILTKNTLKFLDWICKEYK